MKNYEQLTAHERFVLMLEAMARLDEVECDRLADTCPQKTYRCEDAEFRDRIKRAYMVTMTVALNMRAGLARIRMAKAFQETAHLFAGEVAKFATAAYLCGRFNGRAEAGLPTAGPDNPAAVAKELAAVGGFDEQKAEIRGVAEDVVRKLADTLHDAVMESDAADVLSHWEGFGRFCRETLGVEPLTIVRAYGLRQDDVHAVVAARPAADADAALWAAQWTRSWALRFKS